MKNILALAFVAVASASHAVTYTYSGPAVNVTDANTSGVNLTIAAVPSISAINSVTIDMVHSWIGDLRATLTHVPSSTTVVLFSRPGRTSANALESPYGHGDNVDGLYTFAASGADFVAALQASTAVTLPAGGTYFTSNGHGPSSTTSVSNGFFSGGFAAGDWTLNVSDWGGGDTGSVRGFSIDANPVPEPTTMAALGLGLAAVARRRRNKK